MAMLDVDPQAFASIQTRTDAVRAIAQLIERIPISRNPDHGYQVEKAFGVFGGATTRLSAMIRMDPADGATVYASVGVSKDGLVADQRRLDASGTRWSIDFRVSISDVFKHLERRFSMPVAKVVIVPVGVQVDGRGSVETAMSAQVLGRSGDAVHRMMADRVERRMVLDKLTDEAFAGQTVLRYASPAELARAQEVATTLAQEIRSGGFRCDVAVPQKIAEIHVQRESRSAVPASDVREFQRERMLAAERERKQQRDDQEEAALKLRQAAVALSVERNGTTAAAALGYTQTGRILSVDGDRIVQHIGRGTATYSRKELEAHCSDSATLDAALQPGNTVRVVVGRNGKVDLQQQIPSQGWESLGREPLSRHGSSVSRGR